MTEQTKTVTKGIVLAGGAGTRLFPMTTVINKHLLPIHDKPMIYYPLTTLMLAGIKDILIISSPGSLGQFKTLLGDGSRWGLSITYAEQTAPNGIAEAFLIGADFIAGDPVALILGDNMFFGHGLSEILRAGAANALSGACVFSYHVNEPERYGIIALDRNGTPISIVEKPRNPESGFAVTGLYFYDRHVVEIAGTIAPSDRGELEITNLNRAYLEAGRLEVIHLGRGFVWFDTGTPASLAQAGTYVELVQDRQNTGIAYPEEVAFNMGYIGFAQFQSLLADMGENTYHRYLAKVVSEHQDVPPP